MGDDRRFTTLDGLRGFAALLVLFYHVGDRMAFAVPAGYLAVDLFFGLSGFVLARAYEARLRAGLSPGRFALLRLIRIYPMAFVGAAVALALSGRHPQMLLLIPDLASGGALYPTNVPLWSLAFELVVNMAFAFCAIRLGRARLAAVLAGSAAILIVGALRNDGADLGSLWPGAGYGMARTVFSFAVGVAFHRIHVHCAIRRRETRAALMLPAALALVLMALPPHTIAGDLTAIFVLLPAILWLGTVWEAPRNRLFATLGDLSYPLYCIHGTVIQAQDAFPVPPLVLCALLVTSAWWLDRRVDRPVRRWLQRGLAPKREPLATA